MKKCIIFDLDETLGYFTQIYVLCCKFTEITSTSLSSIDLFYMYSEFPNIFRPDIFTLLSYINLLKKKYDVKVVLYTNTLMSITWIETIMDYITNKIDKHTKFFDNYITLDMKCRTNVRKSIDEVYNCCSHLSRDYKYFIVDNKKFHSITDNVEFKLINTYVYTYRNKDMWNWLLRKKQIQNIRGIVDNNIDEEANNSICDKATIDVIDLFTDIGNFIKCPPIL